MDSPLMDHACDQLQTRHPIESFPGSTFATSTQGPSKKLTTNPPVHGDGVGEKDLWAVDGSLRSFECDQPPTIQPKVQELVRTGVYQVSQVAQISKLRAVEGQGRCDGVLVAVVDLVGKHLNKDHHLGG